MTERWRGARRHRTHQSTVDGHQVAHPTPAPKGRQVRTAPPGQIRSRDPLTLHEPDR